MRPSLCSAVLSLLASCAWSVLGHTDSLWPSPLPGERSAAPDVREPELARRPAELVAAAGPLVFDCLPLVALCDPRNAMVRASVGGLWRATPAFAWGGRASVARTHPSDRDTTLMAALTGRSYFADRGALDPYLELSLGAGRFSRHASPGTSLSGRGMTVEAGGGIDFYLGRQLRFGPALHYGQFILGPASACGAAACNSEGFVSVDPARGFATLLVEVTLLAGGAL